MKSIGAMAAITAATLSLVSCGGSDDVSHTAFVDTANRLCSGLTAKQTQLAKDYSAATTDSARQKITTEVATVTSSFITEITTLKAADPDDRAIQDLLRQGTKIAAERATKNDPTLDAQLVDIGKQLRTSFTDGGMDECAKAAS